LLLVNVNQILLARRLNRRGTVAADFHMQPSRSLASH